MNTTTAGATPDHPDQKLLEARRQERVFIFQRWLYIPAVLLTALLFGLLARPATPALAVFLLLANLAAVYFNPRLASHRHRTALSLAMLLADAMAAVWLALICMGTSHTVIYVVFTLIITEAAVRFGLKGSLVADIIFSLGLAAGWLIGPSYFRASYRPADYIVLAGITAFVSLMVGMVAKQWRKQRAAAEALTTERTLLLERRRISNDLHDSILKSLQGLSLEARALGRLTEGKPAAERAQYIAEVCQRLSQDIRGIVLELRDERQRTGAEFTGQVKNMVQDWSRATGIGAEFACTGIAPGLPLKMAHDLRCIITEALANVRSHAEASAVRVALEPSPEQLSLEVTDNGRGFAYDGAVYDFVRQGRLGLASIKERAELSGGSFDIESGPGCTRLRVRLPVPKEPAGE